MAEARLCVLMFILLVQYRNVSGKPFLDSLCDLFCDSDSSSESSSGEDFDLCSFCSDSDSSSSSRDKSPVLFNVTLPAPNKGFKVIVKDTKDGKVSINIDTLEAGAGAATTSAPAAASTTAATTAAAGSTTPGSTTPKK